MIDLEQIKLRLESLNKRRPGHLTPDECSRLLPIFSDLIEEVERLRKDLAAMSKSNLELMGLTDDMQARAIRAEEQVSDLEAMARDDGRRIADLARQLNCSKEIQTAEKKILIAEIEKRAMLEFQLCGMREALEELNRETKQETDWCGICQNWVKSKYRSGSTYCLTCKNDVDIGGENHTDEVILEILASTSKCGHEERIKELETLEGTCPRCGMEQVKVG